MNELETQLTAGAKAMGIDLSSLQIEQFMRYLQLLLKWNKAYNLTAITQPNDIISHHFLDSLALVNYVQGNTLLDVGSGAGFPGLPCALVLSDKRYVLLDSNGKKTRFMTQVVGELGLHNVTIVQSRVEKYHPSECFDTITARAFSSIQTIIEQTAHLLCPEGDLLIMKGVYPSTELNDTTTKAKVIRLVVPMLKEKRHLVVIKGLSNE